LEIQVKQKKLLGWVPEISTEEMCKEMVAYDLEQAKKEKLILNNNKR
jgi:GDPmannose 4,6-dehydratase